MVNSFFKLTPQNNSTIQNKSPEISITLLKMRSNNFNNIKLFVDNKKVPFKFINNKLTYISEKIFHSGKHHVKVTTTDNKGNVNKIKWCFYIKKNKSKKRHKLHKKKYHSYFGVPHSHTSYSTGKGIPSMAFKHALDNNIDFLIITDHCSSLCKTHKKNKSKKSQWNLTENQAYDFNKNNTNFLAMRGFEVSSNHFGDFNVFGSKNCYKSKIKDFKDFLQWLNTQKNCIVSINHPHKYIESFNYNLELDKFINFIEVGNGTLGGKYLNGEKYYYKLLDKGWHLGAINGQDNHKFNWGDSDNLTVVLSNSLKECDFFDALKNRRTYSSESRSLKLNVKANNHFLGSILPKDKKIFFTIKGEDKKNPIKKIQLISNNCKILSSKTFSNKSKFKWDFCVPYEKNKWYVIKITHKNNRCTICSSFFTKNN